MVDVRYNLIEYIPFEYNLVDTYLNGLEIVDSLIQMIE